MIPVAPANVEAAPMATPAPTPTPVPGSGNAAFDAILMLQNLAATAECLDTAGLEPGETTELIGDDDSTDDEDSGEELESSVAFLSDLLTVTMPRNSSGGFEAGAHSRDEAPEQVPMSASPAKGIAEVLALMTEQTPVETDALLAGAESHTDLATTDATPAAPRSGDWLVQAQRAAPLAGADRPALETTVATHVRDPRWADEFGNRISVMVRAGESTASLQLTPMDLGPVEVNVTVKDSQATIHFGASQADTRALLEASLPRLRELLAAQGFNLLDASVTSGFARSQQQTTTPGARGDADSETPVSEVRATRSLSLLDLYA